MINQQQLWTMVQIDSKQELMDFRKALETSETNPEINIGNFLHLTEEPKPNDAVTGDWHIVFYDPNEADQFISYLSGQVVMPDSVYTILVGNNEIRIIANKNSLVVQPTLHLPFLYRIMAGHVATSFNFSSIDFSIYYVETVFKPPTESGRSILSPSLNKNRAELLSELITRPEVIFLNEHEYGTGRRFSSLTTAELLTWSFMNKSHAKRYECKYLYFAFRDAQKLLNSMLKAQLNFHRFFLRE